MNSVLVTVAGYAGAGLVLLAYILVSMGRVSAKAVLYQIMNAVGAALLIYYLFDLGAYANVILNSVWLVVALVALLRLRRA